jgi:hypothetical protein
MPGGPFALRCAAGVEAQAMARSSTVLSIDDFGTVRCAPDVGGPKHGSLFPGIPSVRETCSKYLVYLRPRACHSFNLGTRRNFARAREAACSR